MHFFRSVILAKRMQQCRVVIHICLRLLQRRLHVRHISVLFIIIYIILLLKRHRTVYEVNPLHALLLKSLVQPLERDFLALTAPFVW